MEELLLPMTYTTILDIDQNLIGTGLLNGYLFVLNGYTIQTPLSQKPRITLIHVTNWVSLTAPSLLEHLSPLLVWHAKSHDERPGSIRV